MPPPNDPPPLSGAVLITGASGFIGRHLAARLDAAGVPLRALVRGAAEGLPACVEVYRGDIRDSRAVAAAVAGVETIFHLAGKVHDLDERGDSGEHDAITVGGSDTLAREAAARGVRCLVFFSSLAVYADAEGGPRDESSPAEPSTPYGRAKLAAENLLIERGARAGMHVTCLRPAMVYGAGCRGNLPRMIAAIDRGLFPPPPRIDNRRSLLHVTNLVDAAMLAASNPAASGARYVVTDARPYSTREMFDLLCAGLGKRVPRWSVPASGLRALALAGDLAGRMLGRRVGFDSHALTRLLGSAWFTSARIAADLGYTPAVSFEQRVGELVAAHRAARTS